MAIKISNNTIIDDDRSIINASRAGIGTTNPSNALTVIGDSNITGISTANYFDGFFPGGDKVYNENTTIDNGKVNIALESDIIVESGDTLTVSAGSTIVLNPFDFEKSAVDELLVNKSLTVGFTSSFEAVTSGIASVAANSTSLVGFGTVVPPNIEVGLLVKEIPGVIAAGTTVVSFVSAGTTTGVSTITISPASLNTSVQEDVIFKFGDFDEKKSGIILDGETSTIKAGNNTVVIDGENNKVTIGNILLDASSGDSISVSASNEELLNINETGIKVNSIQTNTPLAGFKNAIINGNFDIWQRGTSFSNPAFGAYTADRWLIIYNGTGATRTISRQAFTLGQTEVPGEPTYFLRFNQSVAGSNNTITELIQRIEGVRTFAGSTITVSFYAKASAQLTLPLIYFSQIFGTGGGQSGNVNAGFRSNTEIGTSWKKISYTFNVPSIEGKTLGPNDNDTLSFLIRLPANTTFTVDIAQVQIEASPVATPFERRPIGTELALCQRYYQTINAYYLTYTAGNGTGFSQTITYPAMRVAPTVTTANAVFLNASGISIQSVSNNKFHFGAACNNAGGVPVSAAADVFLNAEL